MEKSAQYMWKYQENNYIIDLCFNDWFQSSIHSAFVIPFLSFSLDYDRKAFLLKVMFKIFSQQV